MYMEGEMDAATLTAAATHAASSLGYKLYEKQELVVRSFLSGRDVPLSYLFGVLPTVWKESLLCLLPLTSFAKTRNYLASFPASAV